jgi:PAS domain S-box-containing protein
MTQAASTTERTNDGSDRTGDSRSTGWPARLKPAFERLGTFPEPPSNVHRYAFAAGLMAAAVAISVLIGELTDINFVGLLIAAVMLAVWYGGLRGGAVAVVLGALAVWFVLTPPRLSFHADDPEPVVRTLGFLASSSVGGLLYVGARQALRRSRALAAEASVLTKQREELLAEAMASEQRWRSLTENLPLLIGQGGPEGGLSFLTHRWTQYTGIPHEQLMEGDIVKLVHPDDLARLGQVVRRAVDQRASGQVEYRLRTTDGTYRWQLGVIHPVLRAEGDVAYWVGVALDIDDRKRAEALLRESEQRYRTLAEALPSHVVVTTPDGAYEYCNRHHLDYVGLTFEQASRWQDYQVIHPDDYDAAMERWRHSLETGEPLHSELRLRRHDGEYRWFLVTGAPMRDETGTITRWITASVDIHDGKVASEALAEAVAAKDEFLGLVSHELRTPITTILGNAYILERRGHLIAEQDRQQALADIHADAERLHRIIDNLLVLARLERGQEPDLEPLLVDRLVARLVDDTQRRNPWRKLSIEVTGEPELVLASPVYLEQVARNLISNAEKYSPANEPIEIRVAYTESDVRFSVADRGVGIPAAEREAIFTPFYRSQRTAATAQGIGIGLAVCKRLVEAQGGTISARPREGGGSEFEVVLPLETDDAISDAGRPQTATT